MASQSNLGKEFEKEATDTFEKIIFARGLDPLSGKLMTMLYLEPEEISMDDLAMKCGYSLSAVSAKLTFLENFGFIERIKKPGSKKLYFFMKKSMLEVISNKLKKMVEQEFIPVKEIFPKIIEKYAKENQNSKDERFKEQYRIIKKYVEDMERMEKITRKMISELSNS